MTNIVSLDDLRARADKEYAPYKLDVGGEALTLRNVLRLPKGEREEVQSLIRELGDIRDTLTDEDEDGNPVANEDSNDENELVDRSLSIMVRIIEVTADDKTVAAVLLDEIAEDFAMVSILFEDWFSEDEVGEASNSSAG